MGQQYVYEREKIFSEKKEGEEGGKTGEERGWRDREICARLTTACSYLYFKCEINVIKKYIKRRRERRERERERERKRRVRKKER